MPLPVLPPSSHPPASPSSPCPSRRIALAGLVAAAAGVLAGCGGGGGSSLPPPLPVVPTLTMESNAVGTVNGPITVNFLFSDNVSGFGANRFTVNGGTLVAGSFVQITAREYTAQIAPFANAANTIVVEVYPTAFKDATGTVSNTQTYRLFQPYDTVVPVPWVIFSDPVPSLIATGPLTLTMTFNLDVGDSFVEDDLYTTGATLSDFVRVSATVYTVRVSPLPGSRQMYVELPPGAVTAAAVGGVSNPRAWQWVKFLQP